MSIKKNIVIVNEYSVNKDGKGSRGSDMKRYALRYMTRKSAVEPLVYSSPTLQPFVENYMAAKEKAEALREADLLKYEIDDFAEYFGRGFSRGKFALSDGELKQKAGDIQHHFENGKTVFKTVFSFTEQFLRKHKVVKDDFVFTGRGCYSGNIDQSKMRLAVMNGLERMSYMFDDLDYIGAIQTDTKYVHCHLLMVDKGGGVLAKDGTQKGKLLDKHKEKIRGGIVNELKRLEKEPVVTYKSFTGKDKVAAFAKKYLSGVVSRRSFTSYLLTLLPPDSRKWRFKSKSRDMKGANTFLKGFIEYIYTQKDSGFDEFSKQVLRDVSRRGENEGLNSLEMNRAYKQAIDGLTETIANHVYRRLKKVKEKDKTVSTPFLSVGSKPAEILAEINDDFASFLFKFKSYSERLAYHKDHARVASDFMRDYKGQAKRSAASYSCFEFYKNEYEYHTKLISKYGQLLMFFPESVSRGLQEKIDDFNTLTQVKAKIEMCEVDTKATRMRDAATLKRYGREVYGIDFADELLLPGGFSGRKERIDKRLERLKTDIKESKEINNLQEKNGQVLPGFHYDFEEVKALDLHKLYYDFDSDFEVSVVNLTKFFDCTRQRIEMFNKAEGYFRSTGQSTEMLKKAFDIDELEEARATAVSFSESPVFKTKKEDLFEKIEPVYSVSLDNPVGDDIKQEAFDIIRDRYRHFSDE